MALPKEVQTLIPGTCEWVNLHGKKDFAGVIKVLEMLIAPCIIQMGPM